jgi:hypothetical protein
LPNSLLNQLLAALGAELLEGFSERGLVGNHEHSKIILGDQEKALYIPVRDLNRVGFAPCDQLPPRGARGISKMPRFRRWRMPIVVASIAKANRSAHEFADLGVVKASDIDRVEIAAENIEVSAAERANPTVHAEQVMPDSGTELIV